MNNGLSFSLLHLLTEREQFVLELLAKGFLYKEIAYDNDISIDTVKKHSKNIYRKIGARNRTEAAMMFADQQTIPVN